jgi:lipopolysaccharide export system permease protein
MRRITLYILWLHTGPFLLGFSVVTFLLTTDFLLDYLDLLINKGISAWIVLQLFLYALGWMIALSVPCGVLVAVLMAFGRMAQDNEITALRAGGVNPGRALVGPLVVSLLLAVGLSYFNDRILPETNHRYANLLMDIGQKRPAVEVHEGVLIRDIEGYALLVGSVDQRTATLYDVLLVQQSPGPGETPATIVARRGRLRYSNAGTILTLQLWDGEIHEAPTTTPGAYHRLRFASHTINVQGMSTELLRSERTARGDREMTTREMRAEIARTDSSRMLALRRLDKEARRLGFSSATNALAAMYPSPLARLLARFPLPWRKARWAPAEPRSRGLPTPSGSPSEIARQNIDIGHLEIESDERRIDALRVEIHKKFAIPFACVVFVLLGAPLGMRARRGGITVGFVSVGFFIMYYLFLIGGEQLADRQLLPPGLAMWAANVVLGSLGCVLTLSACDLGPRRARGRPCGSPRPLPPDLVRPS